MSYPVQKLTGIKLSIAIWEALGYSFCRRDVYGYLIAPRQAEDLRPNYVKCSGVEAFSLRYPPEVNRLDYSDATVKDLELKLLKLNLRSLYLNCISLLVDLAACTDEQAMWALMHIDRVVRCQAALMALVIHNEAEGP